MDRYCVMGNPVAHSRSPWIHARFAQLTGQTLDYGRREVAPGAFAQSVADFRREAQEAGHRAGGCNVTVPCKFDAATLAGDRLSDRARLAGAVNTLRFDADGGVFGDNTDGAGLVTDIQVHAGRSLAGARVLLIGAGGAAAGVLGPLLDARPARLVLANRTLPKAEVLVTQHNAVAARAGCALQACSLDVLGDGERFDIVVNGTAASLAGAGVPVPARVLAEGALALDMMYGPAAAGFLAWARAHGAVGRDGLGMLVGQAAESFALWRGVRPDAAPVLAELRALVDAGTA
ncbi:shikimate dehydrogenase [Pseudacidovorax sp. RU35E]|uniref:shikimate dehydrogenase n=1 Tax=Pseudacidovorax sp. RU35E TaxID=1907403 RepID=UPI0009567A11|nr:shikimate dehydrogenase [Pseudacidovorax sp. RU35E]SIR45850.1 shikimate dehydrogenase [Pseudacidovorax sp. RU35E]